MKILLAIILIFPIFNIVAQNPVQPKDSTVGKDELIIISPEKKVHSDTSELMIIRDSSQKHKEANISELFIIGRNAYKRGHICKNDQADGAGTGVCDSIMVSSISVIPTIRCTKAQHMKNTENLWNWIGVILLQCNSMSLNTVSIWYIEITSVLYGGPGLNISGYGSKIIIVP